MESKRKILTLPILIVAIIIIVIGFFGFYQKKSKTFSKLISVTGVIVDLETNKPLNNLFVKADENRVITDQNGIFKFEKIPSDAILLINGGSLYEDVSIPVSGRTNINFFLSSKLLSIFRDIESYEQNRQYRKLYELFSDDIKKHYSQDEYIQLKNYWRDDIIAKKNYNIFRLVIDRSSIKKISGKQASAMASYEWSKDGQKF
ncbi:MAG: hypothetical protein C0412_21670, partial [Flavobacterium sp.]|nr:hypothetical protein [Flavobacterium sp.]